MSVNLTTLAVATTIANMSASLVTTTRWSDDVIRRAVRAWIAGYGIHQDTFAVSIGMKPRTFARRLAGEGPRQAFTGGEIARMSTYMSEVCGDKVSIEDLYAGRISVWGQLDGPQAAEAVNASKTNPYLLDTVVVRGPWVGLPNMPEVRCWSHSSRTLTAI